MRLGPLVPVLALVLPATEPPGRRAAEPPAIEANDNRTPAGILANGTLEIRLVAQAGRWHPEADDGPGIVVAALGEEGRAPAIPAPLIRVRLGTRIHATIRNALLDVPLVLHGLSPDGDSLVIPPGETRETGFTPDAAGTFLYWATRGTEVPAARGAAEEEQLGGALVVDPPEGSPPDRVWVINIWSDRGDSTATPRRPPGSVLAINGKSWPFTERSEVGLRDSVRWRWVNASRRPHPMHLHGFYYRMTARGGAQADTAISADAQRLTVTEVMRSRSTMVAAFAPDRPGNWLFHCHLIYHVLPSLRDEIAGAAGADAHRHDPGEHMAGLVLGFHVPNPQGWSGPSRIGTRTIRLLALEEPRPGSLHGVRMGFTVDPGRGPPPTAPDPAAPLLVLHRGQPTDIRVVNRLGEPTAIHWHGIELESWSDGVAGWSGSGLTVAPMIAPGDSFTAQLTLPRAGTFIYHTHFNDDRQLLSGMYGPIVVLPPRARFDPATDHIFVAGVEASADGQEALLVNGSPAGGTLRFRAGRAHRLRFINITPANFVRITWAQDTTPLAWRPVAKDGADLPAGQTASRPGRTVLALGQAEDYLVSPAPGTYRLLFQRAARREPEAVYTVEVR
ncbi:MAG TPA: multicopper oxidase domain-containing protein [Gemmatimonadales bacterium]|nr:multicopper oxidase domain-containing protein [Gemmatimonadales bacterium]